MLGYQNKVLRINLTEKKASTEPLRMDFAEKYVGSKGLVIRYMYEELQPGIDALGPDNKLFLTTGPFTGTPVPCSGKLSVAAKSPATGTMNDCSIGGHAGIRIKFAGYDMIIFEGQLAEPGYVVIEDDEIKFVDAGDLWGKGSHEAESILSEKYGREFSILSIGPAGENLSNMACINSDYYRQAGRGGIGAVMGSKKMKAILVKGTGGVKVPDIVKTTDRILEILHEDVLQEDNTFVYDTGTTAFLEACNDGGILPWKNFSDTTDEQWTEYNGDVLMESREGKRGCGSCGLGCGNFLKIGDAVCEGPEYETISVAGPNAGIRDPYAIVKFNQVADDMGLDTISAGDTIIWAMEMTEKGLHDFGIKFGDGEGMVRLLKEMATRTGVGAELADGVKIASEKYGGTDFAMQVKGLEYPQYEPRGSWGMSLAYAVSDRGACHMRAYAPNEEVFAASIPPYTPEGKGQMVYNLGEFNAIKFSLCICDFWGTISYDIMAELLTLVTGREWTAEEMGEVGRRVLNIGRAFNQREGFNRAHDTVPKRVIKDALKSGPAAGQVIPPEAFEDMLDQYYEVMGWNKDGTMPEELIQSIL
ncbi:MAG: aldehyde ferredoxin oxidoreductase family protein [Firmicutes bacterium]|nr:aldehyde ferredoxin oxidoreductase family protein [Bacillota bacterium]MBR2620641.1 aldehyde ferredoxin oxidoreductase family protein [Bacillota bacterium]MBR3787714.1 aldehyde ferredoxin oxidoreductase family protein [Bacillota bacterium]